MSKRSKTWLVVAAIISILYALTLVVGGVLVWLDKFNLSYYYIRVLKLFAHGVTSEDVFALQLIIVILLGLCATINVVCAINYIKISHKHYPAINDYFYMCFVCVAQFVFGFAIVPTIIVFIVALRNQHIYTTVVKNNNFDLLKSKVAKLNKQRDAGLIDSNNYSKQLDTLLTAHVKNTKDN